MNTESTQLSLPAVMSLAQWRALATGTLLRPRDKKGFVLVPQRWVVERSFGWFGRSRRLSKHYERWPENSEGMVYLASIQRLVKHLAQAA